MIRSKAGNHRNVLATCFLLGFSILTRDAEAANIVIPGTACGITDMAADGYFGSHGVIWADAADVTVWCPITRMSYEGTLDNVWVRVYNAATLDGAISCYVYSRSADSSSQDMVSVSGNTPGFMSLSVSMSGFTEYSAGSYALACELQDGDGVVSIRYYEP